MSTILKTTERPSLEAGRADPAVAGACINTIRALAMDAVEQANSGHPGAPMALAPAAFVLWTRFLRHNPQNPAWPDRDRFVLSCGHSSMLLYALLHLTGYDLPLEELGRFRQWGSRTPGHPERDPEIGIETTTGPLGQGVGNAVGMAIAERFLAERFNRPGYSIVHHRVWAFVSDGDLMEGITSEAASLAGHLRLGRLNLIYDDNQITIEGRTDLAFSEDVGRRFEAYGWHVRRVADGNDLDGIERALTAARTEETRPSLVVLRTRIADPAPNKGDTADAHGAPLGAEEVRLTKEIMRWPQEPAFHVPEPVLEFMRRTVQLGVERSGGGGGCSSGTAGSTATWRRSSSGGWAGSFPRGGIPGCPPSPRPRGRSPLAPPPERS
jgi:transketolase